MSSKNRPTKVLIVEDDTDIRDLMQALLETEGYEADAACNGQDALDRLRAKSDSELPDLILLDLMMPVKDGFAFREEQKRDPRIADVPVVLITADAHFEEKRTRIGARAAIRKPLDLDKFLKLLDELTRAPAATTSLSP